MRALWVVLVASTLSACATLSEEECLYADWYQIGYEDGSQGKDTKILARHRKACAKAGVTPDRIAYAKGHEQGLYRYCTYATGLSLGVRGNSKPNFCSANTQVNFDLGYAHGVERFQKQQYINQIINDIRSIEERILDYQERLFHYEAILMGKTTSSVEREQALIELRATELDLKLLVFELAEAEKVLALERAALDQIISRQQ